MGQLTPPGTADRRVPSAGVADGTSTLAPMPLPGPTDVSFEIGACYLDPPTTLHDLTHAQGQVLAWLMSFRDEIAGAEREFRVDRRAIAGAIAWEMLENVRTWSPRSVGAGKIHLYNYSPGGAALGAAFGGVAGALAGALDFDTVAVQVEETGYLPRLSFFERKARLATPEGAIRYIAAILCAFADIAARLGFGDIRADPVVLTNAYQSKTLKTWEAHLRGKPAGERLQGGNPMDVWVAAHLRYLEEGVGAPQVPR